MRRVKAKWAAKLLKSKHFVVLTDKESVICFQGVDPESISDFIALAAQSSELEDFSDKLKELIKRHDVAAKKLGGTRAKKTNTVKRSKKIAVKG